MKVPRAPLALALALLAPPAQAEGAQTAQIDAFAGYAQAWCGLGDAEGCSIAGKLTILSQLLASAAARCDEGERDACADAWTVRRFFWINWGHLPVAPDMLPGTDGTPPARPLWDQPDPGPWFPAPCDAFMAQCGYFGDPSGPHDFSAALGGTLDMETLAAMLEAWGPSRDCDALIPACGYFGPLEPIR